MTALSTNLRTGRTFIGRPVAVLYPAILLASLPAWPFGWHLGMHVLGAAMLVGNALVMAVWLSVAGFAGGDRAKRRAAMVVNVGDVWLTVPGVLLILLNGLAMVAERYGGTAAFAVTPWISGGLALLLATGLIWALKLVPAQLHMHRLAAAEGPLDVRAFRGVLNRWYVWGVVATIMPLMAVALMTLKPMF